MNYALTCTAVAVGWSGYIDHILDEVGIALPAELSAAPGAAQGAIFNLPAFGITLVLTGVLLFGIRESAWLNRIMVVVKVSVLTVFIVLGATMVDPENLSPFTPFGFGGIMSGAAVVFFAYMGFDAHATVSEEAQDPKRNMPRAIVVALLVCTVFYMGVALVLSGLVPIGKIDTAAPLAGAFISHGVRWAASVVAVGAWFAITNVLFVSLLAQPRILMSLSRDGLAPARFATINRRTQIPQTATIILGLVVAVLAGLTPITQAAEMGNIGALFVFALVCWMVVRLRKDRPDLHRTFKVPLVPALPLAGAGACIALMLFLHYSTWLMFMMWLGIGFIVYANYGMKRGVSSKRQKKGS
jgi:APA family basic amino acid/polyamine antiporter